MHDLNPFKVEGLKTDSLANQFGDYEYEYPGEKKEENRNAKLWLGQLRHEWARSRRLEWWSFGAMGCRAGTRRIRRGRGWSRVVIALVGKRDRCDWGQRSGGGGVAGSCVSVERRVRDEGCCCGSQTRAPGQSWMNTRP